MAGMSDDSTGMRIENLLVVTEQTIEGESGVELSQLT
jgi:hypothetical protein